MEETLALSTLALAVAALLAPKAKRRLELSRAKHRSLAGHSRMAKRVAALIPGYAYDEARFFNADGVAPELAARRKAGFKRLAEHFAATEASGIAMSERAKALLPDLRFTASYRVPFQFSPYLRERLRTGNFVRSSQGPVLENVDGTPLHDLAGSYGVNLFGYGFYKDCIAEGQQLVGELGPVLGSYHPLVLENAERLATLSGQDCVSFHMSGTEAVMQAVRLARYHTGRSHLVRFCGAYHGWWDDVQPGPGNPSKPRDTYTLKDMDERSLKVLATRKDIACVLVNPLQALHPNASAPGDSTLVDSSRRAGFDRAAYTAWLHKLRGVCTARGIVLIFDEVFLGFRLAKGGAQEYFGVKADLVTYGKTLGGGLPVGVVCGRAALMQRFREDRPADICFARGTFNSHPYVMGAMNAFLRRIEEPAAAQIYEGLDERWTRHLERFNARLEAAGVPLRMAGMGSVWTVLFTRPSRYNWMLQYYVREQGLALSWVGSGRLIWSLDHDEAAVDDVAARFVSAGKGMQRDGWWHEGTVPDNKSIRRSLLKEMLRQKLGL
ncbi:MAG: aminotransferase class III-fold pyridoxal phosphate-dependent enzyme [Paucibacter sp.]|nr:aminotransferase class III-fold pyridoxal phosphate-dependent enzyme [Roseateles sp.]